MIFHVEGSKRVIKSLVRSVQQNEELGTAEIRLPEFYHFAKDRDWVRVSIDTPEGTSMMLLLRNKSFNKTTVKVCDSRGTKERELVKPINKASFYPMKRTEVQRVSRTAVQAKQETKYSFEEDDYSEELQDSEELEQWEERIRRG